MDLFTYLMAKRGHNSSVHGDFASYLMGKGQAGIYVTKSGVSVTVNNSLKGKIKNWKFKGMTSQDGEPTPDNPIPVKVVTGDNNLTISNQDGTQSQNYPLNLGTIELCEIGDYQDKFFKAIDGDETYDSLDSATKSSLTSGNWYLQKNIGKVVLGDLAWIYDSNNKLFQASLPSEALLTRGIDFKCGICVNGGNKPTIDLIVGEGEIVNNGNIYIKDTTHTTTTDFINDIGNEILNYILATPTYTTLLTSLQNQLEAIYKEAHSYNGVTNVTTTYEDGNEQMILEFEIKTSN